MEKQFIVVCKPLQNNFFQEMQYSNYKLYKFIILYNGEYVDTILWPYKLTDNPATIIRELDEFNICNRIRKLAWNWFLMGNDMNDNPIDLYDDTPEQFPLPFVFAAMRILSEISDNDPVPEEFRPFDRTILDPNIMDFVPYTSEWETYFYMCREFGGERYFPSAITCQDF